MAEIAPYHIEIKPIGTCAFSTPLTSNEVALTLPFTFSLNDPGSFVPIPTFPANV
jgi:hypothetical protein